MDCIYYRVLDCLEAREIWRDFARNAHCLTAKPRRKAENHKGYKELFASGQHKVSRKNSLPARSCKRQEITTPVASMSSKWPG